MELDVRPLLLEKVSSGWAARRSRRRASEPVGCAARSHPSLQRPSRSSASSTAPHCLLSPDAVPVPEDGRISQRASSELLWGRTAPPSHIRVEFGGWGVAVGAAAPTEDARTEDFAGALLLLGEVVVAMLRGRSALWQLLPARRRYKHARRSRRGGGVSAAGTRDVLREGPGKDKAEGRCGRMRLFFFNK